MEARSSFFPQERETHVGMNDWVMIGAPGELAHKDAREINTLSFEMRAIFVDTLTKRGATGWIFLGGSHIKT
ncbi:MAG: hypothetical protein DMG52_31710 [Acidobacteria bacterium]|nr:MAG: hypothetical protein DMG52_31710 [Acidobacteriota bacterium]